MRAFTARRLVRSLARDARVSLGAAAAALALVVLAATGCDDSGGGPATSIAPLWFDDIVASADVSFEVAFRAQGLYFNGPERFVWRQGNGLIRWDIVASRSGEPDMGWISVESEIRRDEGYYAMKCLWYRQASLAADGTPQASVSCSASGSVAERLGPLFSAVSSSFDERLPDQTVAGRKASCYSFDDPTMSVAVFCVDALQGVPLLLSTVDPDPRLTQELRALSVSTAKQDLGFPVELEKHPVTHEWQFEGMVPMSTLQLPDFSQFEE